MIKRNPDEDFTRSIKDGISVGANEGFIVGNDVGSVEGWGVGSDDG
jgi:hypothetical protein